MSHLTDATRAESVAKLRQAADLLEGGNEMDAGKTILSGLGPVARDLKRTYGPMVKMIVNSWIRRVFDEG